MTGFAMDSFLDNIDDIHDVIRVYPMQLQDTAYSTMLRADILVNIGNTVSFQTPGKIFEYMAMGKPIIHFQKTVDDPCLKYFKDYPMVLIINELENDPVKHAQMIEEFCRQNQKRTLSFEEVSQIIPQYTSKQVVNGFVQLIDNIANEANHAKE